jgi:D-glycero-D-manno-heptose 1,7-bisphosphate phosphatase
VRFVFLDRDGVLNRKMPEGNWVTSPGLLDMLDGAAAAVATLNQLGIRIIVVTNQRGIAAGFYTEAGLAAVHEHMRARLAAENAQVDAIYYCPHDRNACDCRKPKPGMLLQAFGDFPGSGPANSLMIGDSLSDIEAGRAAAIPTVFIDGDASNQSPGAAKARSLADYCSGSLAAFVQAAVG